MKAIKVLIVDDKPESILQISRWLKRKKWIIKEAATGEAAIEQVRKSVFDVVLLDLVLPGIDGFEVLRQINRDYPETCVLILTAYAETWKTEKALNEGAFDFFDKLTNYEQLVLRIENAINRFFALHEQVYQQEDEQREYSFENIIGKSQAMQNVFELSRKVAKANMTVLLQGETGTGKNLFALAIHNNSLRAKNKLITADCGSSVEGLVESELFGHEQGAFTGAFKRRRGKVERADKSSLFIDEIGEMTPKLQAKLLRFLQEKVFERVGGEQELRADVRVIAATNKILIEEMNAGRFRSDLFYRLNKFPIYLPALRERTEDIPLLAEYFLKKFNQKLRKQIFHISDAALNLLMNYHFPGNVRELENILERAVLLEDTKALTVKSLMFYPGETGKKSELVLADIPFQAAKAQFEEKYIRDALKKTNQNISQAATLAGMDRSNFRDKMKKYNIETKRKTN